MKKTPIYFLTTAVYAALVGVGFFGRALETPRLVVIAIALAITAAKFIRLGMRGDEDPRTRRDDFEAGGLLVVLGGILVQATGGPASAFVPLTYLLVAILAA